MAAFTEGSFPSSVSQTDAVVATSETLIEAMRQLEESGQSLKELQTLAPFITHVLQSEGLNLPQRRAVIMPPVRKERTK